MMSKLQDDQPSLTFTSEESEQLRMELMRISGENAILRQKLEGEQTAKREAERLTKQVSANFFFYRSDKKFQSSFSFYLFIYFVLCLCVCVGQRCRQERRGGFCLEKGSGKATQ